MVKAAVGAFLLFLVTTISAQEDVPQPVDTTVSVATEAVEEAPAEETSNEETPAEETAFFTIEWDDTLEEVTPAEEEPGLKMPELPDFPFKKGKKEKKAKKKSDSGMGVKKARFGASVLGGFSVGSGNMLDLNANYSVQLLLKERVEFYAIGGHGLGFDSYRKFRVGGAFYLGNPQAFRVGLGIEAGPAFMERVANDTTTSAFAWGGGRLTLGYRFKSGLFTDVYAVASIYPDMINEAGIRLGYYF